MHQRPLLVGPILIGGLPFEPTPELFGPRNCGQLTYAAPESQTLIKNATQVATNKNPARSCIILFGEPGKNGRTQAPSSMRFSSVWRLVRVFKVCPCFGAL